MDNESRSRVVTVPNAKCPSPRALPLPELVGKSFTTIIEIDEFTTADHSTRIKLI